MRPEGVRGRGSQALLEGRTPKLPLPWSTFCPLSAILDVAVSPSDPTTRPDLSVLTGLIPIGTFDMLWLAWRGSESKESTFDPNHYAWDVLTLLAHPLCPSFYCSPCHPPVGSLLARPLHHLARVDSCLPNRVSVPRSGLTNVQIH